MLTQRTLKNGHRSGRHVAKRLGRRAAIRTDEGILGTIDFGALWLQLALSPAQVSTLTGIPARRIRRWIKRGWLIPSSGNPMRCSGQTVEQAIFLDRALARGCQPEHAVHLVRVHQLRQLQRWNCNAASDGYSHEQPQQRIAQEFAEVALRMLLLDLLEAEDAPDSPGAA